MNKKNVISQYKERYLQRCLMRKLSELYSIHLKLKIYLRNTPITKGRVKHITIKNNNNNNKDNKERILELSEENLSENQIMYYKRQTHFKHLKEKR